MDFLAIDRIQPALTTVFVMRIQAVKVLRQGMSGQRGKREKSLGRGMPACL